MSDVGRAGPVGSGCERSRGLSVDEVERAAGELATQRPDVHRLEQLCAGRPFVAIDRLVAGYGRMEILHGLDVRVSQGQSLCLIGPNGAGKSTLLHSIQGFTQIMSVVSELLELKYTCCTRCCTESPHPAGVIGGVVLEYGMAAPSRPPSRTAFCTARWSA